MEYSTWRFHSGFIIVEHRTAVFRRRRYGVWQGTELQGLFKDAVAAELFIDRSTDSGADLSRKLPVKQVP